MPFKTKVRLSADSTATDDSYFTAGIFRDNLLGFVSFSSGWGGERTLVKLGFINWINNVNWPPKRFES